VSGYAEFRIPVTHACLAGHFPGEPVVPGVLVLQRVIGAISVQTDARIAGIRRCKFVAPLRPGQICSVRWTVADSGIRFTCRNVEGTVAQGVLQVADG